MTAAPIHRPTAAASSGAPGARQTACGCGCAASRSACAQSTADV